jgi:hypothetical protein
MTDVELIMQLARLEEIGEMNQLGENGISASNSKDNLKKEDSILSRSSNTPTNILEEENQGGAKGVQDESSLSPNLITPKKTTDTHTGNDELQALADLEKELGLDDLQLYLDSTSTSTSVTTPPLNLVTPNTKTNDNKNSKSDFSMGVETGGSTGSFATPATVMKGSQIEEDDDNLDELERYLESLSVPTKK